MPDKLDASGLINREVQLSLVSQSPTDNKYFSTTGNALIVTDLRVQFEIKKSLGKEPNAATCTITNMSKDSRGRLERKPVYVQLLAGHNGVLHPLFAGSLSFARSNLKTPNWETKIQVADGGRAYAHARLNRSYSPPTTAKQILGDLANAMDLKLPSEFAAVEELNQALTATGTYPATGLVRDLLTRVLTPLGYSWSIQDGRLQILKSGLPNAKSAWLIDVDAGMIGSPEGSVPSKPGGTSELSIDVLLFPEIAPGDTIQVHSRAYDGGFFRVNDVTHTGDTHGAEWKTSIKATPLGSPPPKKGRGKK